MLLIITVIITAAAAYSIFRSKITPVKVGANLPSAYAAILNREVGFYQKLAAIRAKPAIQLFLYGCGF